MRTARRWSNIRNKKVILVLEDTQKLKKEIALLKKRLSIVEADAREARKDKE